jgi:Flp pilus assembly pilin Flp
MQQRQIIIRFAASQDGSAAVEYGLLIGAIALSLLAVFFSYGAQLLQIGMTIASGVAQITAFTNF